MRCFYCNIFHFEIECVKVNQVCHTAGKIGHTLHINYGNWQTCADKCYLTSNCVFWELQNFGGPHQCQLYSRCTLRARPPETTALFAGDNHCHSVALSCTDAHVTCNDRNDINLIRKIDTITSWEDCGNHCKKDRHCNFWTYHNTHKCDLFKSCPSPTSSPGYLKGHKKCPSSSKYPF